MQRTIYDIRHPRCGKGFTLVELLVGLIVTAIIMSAVATLAFAFSSANDATDDTDRKQAQLRYATLKISELIRHCKLICGTPDNSIVIWKADDSPADDEIDILELAYIDAGSGRDEISIIEFTSCPDWLSSWWSYVKANQPELWVLQQSSIREFLLSRCETTEIEVIPECDNVQFSLDNPDNPPSSQFVNISFELTENGLIREYHIDSALRCWAGHLLNEEADGLEEDDD